MAALFKPRANFFTRLALAALMGGALLTGAIVYGWNRSSYVTNQGVVVEQPVPFSHQHHAGAIGIDCLYCHTTVEKSPHAGLPPTQTCMNCHQQIWTEAPVLEPVRESWRTGVPIKWARVHRLPDFVYFNHSIHVNKGVGCAQCHGRIDQMPLTYAAAPLTMEWCLDCHRNPGPRLRPANEIRNIAWKPTAEQSTKEFQHSLLTDYKIRTHGLTDCSTCHR